MIDGEGRCIGTMGRPCLCKARMVASRSNATSLNTPKAMSSCDVSSNRPTVTGQ